MSGTPRFSASPISKLQYGRLNEIIQRYRKTSDIAVRMQEITPLLHLFCDKIDFLWVTDFPVNF